MLRYVYTRMMAITLRSFYGWIRMAADGHDNATSTTFGYGLIRFAPFAIRCRYGLVRKGTCARTGLNLNNRGAVVAIRG